MHNTLGENISTVPAGFDGEPHQDSAIDRDRDETSLEVVLTMHKPEIDRALEVSNELIRDESMNCDGGGFEQYWEEHVIPKLGVAAKYLNENQDFYEHMRAQAKEKWDYIQREHPKVCEKTFKEKKEFVENKMVLTEEEIRDESLFHPPSEERLREYLLGKIRNLKIDVNEEMYKWLWKDVIEDLLEERVKQYMKDHEGMCEKTFEKMKKRVENEMVLSEDELQKESLFHPPSKERLRKHLLGKIRELKVDVNEEMYKWLWKDVIEDLLEERVEQYMKDHEGVCEKTFREKREYVENEMVLDSSEQLDDALFEQGEGAVRERLLEKIRELKVSVDEKMYEWLWNDVIEQLLGDRVRGYMNEYQRRKAEEKDDDRRRDKDEEMNGEDETDADSDADADGEAGAETSQEGQQETAAEGASEATNEGATTSETNASETAAGVQSSESGISTDSAQQTTSESGNTGESSGESSKGSETVTSQESVTQASETSASSQSESAARASSSTETAKKAGEKEEAKASEQQKEESTQEEQEASESSKLGELAGIKQLLTKGGAYFQPFLLKWEESLDSAQHRKAAYEISSRAKTAEAFVQWLSGDQKIGSLKKQYLREWQQFAFGLQLFGLADKQQETENHVQEEVSEEAVTEEVEMASMEGLRDLPEEPIEEEEEATAAINAPDEEPVEENKEESTPDEIVEVNEAEEIQEVEESEPAELEINPAEAKVSAVEEQDDEVQELEESSGQEEYVEGFAAANEGVLEMEAEVVPLESIEESDELEGLDQLAEEDDAEETTEAINSYQEFLDEPFEATLLEDEGLEEEDGESMNVESMIGELEESEELVGQVEGMEESLWEMVDDVMVMTEDSELDEEYAEELENLDALFQHLVEHGMELPQGPEPIHENEENQEECNAQNLRRLILLLTSLVPEQKDAEGRVQRPRTTPELFQALIEQLSGANSLQLEMKILAILRYYPQFRFLLLLMLRKQYMESQDARYIRLMMLIYQEQYGSKVMGLHEMAHMLTRFARFLGKKVESEHHIHEKLQDYTIINANEIFCALSQRVCSFQGDIHRLQFVSGLHHCRFDHLTGQAKALLHMNIEGGNLCCMNIGCCRLIAGSERKLEAA